MPRHFTATFSLTRSISSFFATADQRVEEFIALMSAPLFAPSKLTRCNARQPLTNLHAFVVSPFLLTRYADIGISPIPSRPCPRIPGKPPRRLSPSWLHDHSDPRKTSCSCLRFPSGLAPRNQMNETPQGLPSTRASWINTPPAFPHKFPTS